MSTTPFKVKAVYAYNNDEAIEAGDLTFPNGQIITVIEDEDAEWYTGQYVDATGAKKEGIFPRNFVEKYEPEVPSRPTRPSRPKKEAEPSMPPEPVSAPRDPPEAEPEHQAATKAAGPQQGSSAPLEAPVSPPTGQAASKQVRSAAPASPLQSVSKPSHSTSKPAPSQTAEKPDIGSFRDRIAAFNKPAAPPVAPFKLGGSGSSGGTGFIKKPFVAPPPSKDAYVHQPREPPPQKIYRREEDPELTREAEPADVPSTATESAEGVADEDQPKPTSLKDRIALLQKQQLEQAARHAEAAQKKEKPKRPPKKRVESQEQLAAAEADRGAELEKVDTEETIGKTSTDIPPYEEPIKERSTARRQASTGSHLANPPQPSRELVSDTNDADYSGGGDTEEVEESSTSREDSDEKPRPHTQRSQSSIKEVSHNKEEEEEDEDGDEEEAEEEEDVDPEVKRRMEIRERMAKMSGGMGMMGMFGPPGAMPMAGAGPKKQRPSGDSDRKPSGGHEKEVPPAQAPPVPIMAFPGMNRMKGPEHVQPEPEVEMDEGDEEERNMPISEHRDPEDMPDVEDVAQANSLPARSSLDRAPHPVPQERAVPPPPPPQSRPVPPPVPSEHPNYQPSGAESRGAPPPPTRAPVSPSPGEESDDEMSLRASRLSLKVPDDDNSRPQSKEGPPTVPRPGGAPQIPSRPQEPRSPQRPSTQDTSSPISPSGPGFAEKRSSRGMPPIPLASPTTGSPPQARLPPPPPPSGQLPSRKSTVDSKAPMTTPKHQVDNDSEEEVTEYDGDYDTDIASGAKHKDALKAHGRDSSLDEGAITDEPQSQSPTSPRPPPLPTTTAPRSVPPPPPPPAQPPKSTRKSSDMPRAAPPPVPPPKEALPDDHDDYDPYSYSAPQYGMPPGSARHGHGGMLQSPSEAPEEEDLYSTSPVQQQPPPMPSDRSMPLAPSNQAPHAPLPARNAPRQSPDVHRSGTNSRRSMEAPRPSGESGFIATDADLAQNSLWWTQPNTPPPVFQNRKDLVYEMEESTSSKRGGKSTVSKDVYILFMDYSQTVITVSYDARNPSDVNLEQRHERPPAALRQDQLETASTQFGARISEAMTSKQNTTVGDGTAHSLVLELLRPLPSALAPVGTRAYGALVYANLANASIQQYDEIRAGDIVTFRNAKFQGHRGPVHQKYGVDVGKPDHVGVVVDWDGTKKKVRAWEQGREDGGKISKKTKVESFKLGDLRSGEVKVWRVMGRNWVGWESPG